VISKGLLLVLLGSMRNTFFYHFMFDRPNTVQVELFVGYGVLLLFSLRVYAGSVSVIWAAKKDPGQTDQMAAGGEDSAHHLCPHRGCCLCVSTAAAWLQRADVDVAATAATIARENCFSTLKLL
jgi:hypothetical protein